MSKKEKGCFNDDLIFHRRYKIDLEYSCYTPPKHCFTENLIFHKRYKDELDFSCPEDNIPKSCHTEDLIFHREYTTNLIFSCQGNDEKPTGPPIQLNGDYFYGTSVEYTLYVPRPVYLESEHHFGANLEADVDYHKAFIPDYIFGIELDYNLQSHIHLINEYHYGIELYYNLLVPKPVYLEEILYYNTHLHYELEVYKPIYIESEFYYNTHIEYNINHYKTIPNSFEYNTNLEYYLHVPKHVYIENDFYYNTTFTTQFNPFNVFLSHNHFYYGVNIITEGFDYLSAININCILPHLKEHSYDINIDLYDINTLHYDDQPLAYIQFISGLSYRNRMKDMDFTFGVNFEIHPYDMALEVEYPLGISFINDNSFFIEMNLCDHNYTEFGHNVSIILPHEEPECKSIGFYYGIHLHESLDPIMNRINFYYNTVIEYDMIVYEPFYFEYGTELADKLGIGAGLLPRNYYGISLEYDYHKIPIYFHMNIGLDFFIHFRVKIDLLDDGCLPNQKVIVDEYGKVIEEETIGFAMESREYEHSIRYKVHALRGGTYYDLSDIS